MNVKLASSILIAATLLGGCQSAGGGGYSDTVQGDYLTVASCFAQQPVEATNEQRTGGLTGLTTLTPGSEQRAQPPSLRQVTVNDPGSRTVVVEVGTATAGGYSVTFTGLTDKTTEVRARAIGFPARYFWPNEVAPLVARCSGRISS